MSKKLPTVLIDARVYEDNSYLIGHGNVTLPDIQYMTETVKGAGIAGEIDMPLLGQTQSMQLSINWTTPTADTVKMLAPESKMLTIRGSAQIYDLETGKAETMPITVVVKTNAKGLNLGELEKAAGTNSGNTFEILMIKVMIAGRELLLIDKPNCIFKVDGKDYLTGVRNDLGM
jgi:P2 family phage contractile tail tube protein